MHAPTATVGRLREQARVLTLREVVREILDAYARNDVLTYASAIAFQVFFALIPLMMFAFGLMGFLGLSNVYEQHVAPSLHSAVSPNAYTLIDDTIRKVLGGQQFFWITIGAVITVWEMSGAVRAVMQIFDRIYHCKRERSFKERYLTSSWLALASGILFLAAVAVFTLGPLTGTVLSILRWPIDLVLLTGTVALLVRFAPAERQPAGWVSFGSLLTVVAWLGTSVVFALYVRNVADYNSIFGALSVVIVCFEYLYLAAIAFLTGAQLDALLRERLERAQS